MGLYEEGRNHHKSWTSKKHFQRMRSMEMCITNVKQTWHHKMSGKLHLLVLRYIHFYTATNKENKKILTDIIKFISILENGNSGIFGIISKLVCKEEDYIKISFSMRSNFPPILWCQVTYMRG